MNKEGRLVDLRPEPTADYVTHHLTADAEPFSDPNEGQGGVGSQPAYLTHVVRGEFRARAAPSVLAVGRVVVPRRERGNVVGVDAGALFAAVVSLVAVGYGAVLLLVVVAVHEVAHAADLGHGVAAYLVLLPDPTGRLVTAVLYNVIGREGVLLVVASKIRARLALHVRLLRVALQVAAGLAAAPAPAKAVGSVGAFSPPGAVLVSVAGYSVDDALQSGCPRRGVTARPAFALP